MANNGGISVELLGAREVAAYLKDFNKATEGLVEDIVLVNANEAAAQAQRDAPKRFGKLQGSISVRKVNRFSYGVGSNVTYAAYQEFGTGKYAKAYVPSLPSSVRRLAARYRGKGIRNVNIRAKKYLYDNVVRQVPILLQDLTDAINGLIK